jgi:hypothetical protein
MFRFGLKRHAVCGAESTEEIGCRKKKNPWDSSGFFLLVVSGSAALLMLYHETKQLCRLIF